MGSLGSVCIESSDGEEGIFVSPRDLRLKRDENDFKEFIDRIDILDDLFEVIDWESSSDLDFDLKMLRIFSPNDFPLGSELLGCEDIDEIDLESNLGPLLLP